MTATAALEHLMWTRLKVEDDMSRKSYEDLGSPGSRLAVLAARASIPDRLDATLTPALDAFAQTRSDTPTAPIVLFALRNKIVHPTGHEMTLYERFPGLMVETWYLAWHCLVLLILHWLGYEGATSDYFRHAAMLATSNCPVAFSSGPRMTSRRSCCSRPAGPEPAWRGRALPWPEAQRRIRAATGLGGSCACSRGRLGIARSPRSTERTSSLPISPDPCPAPLAAATSLLRSAGRDRRVRAPSPEALRPGRRRVSPMGSAS